MEISMTAQLLCHVKNFVAITYKDFAQHTTAILSWLVQKCVAIYWPETQLQQNEISIKFELQVNNY